MILRQPRRGRVSVVLSLAAVWWAAQAGLPASAGPADRPVASAPATQPAGDLADCRLVDRPDEIIARLETGLTVIVKRYAAAPVVSVQMHVKAGSLWEDNYAATGISHLFEHLLAGAATARRTEQQSRQTLERIGARSNAYTSQEQTVYYIDVPSQHVAAAVELLADWVTRPTFPPEEVERELGVVQRELERGLQEPDRQLWHKANEVRYLVSPARFPVIGHKAALTRLTRQDILAYHRKMYVPSRVVVAVVGDIDPQAVLKTIKKEFADFAAAADQPIVLPQEPPVSAPRTLVHRMDVAQVRFWIGFPTVELLHEDLYPLDVLMYVLAAGESSRLRVELRDRQKLALSIDAGSWTPAWGPGSFYVNGVCLPDHWPALEKAILAEFARLRDQPVDAESLAQAKRQAVVGHIRSHQTAAAMAGSLASNQLLIGDAHFDDQYLRRLEAVTADQIQAAARKYFDPNKLLTALVVPRQMVLPARPGMAATGPSTGPGSTTQPEQAITVSPIRKVTLDNGLTVLLRRNTAVPLVSVQMHFGGGLLAESPEQNGLCQLMVRAALRGTPGRSAEQVFAAFERAGGGLASNSGRNSFSFSASMLSDDLAQLLPLFAEVVTRPAFSADEVDKLKGLTLAAIQRIPDQLEPNASRFFFEKFYGSHAYGRPVIGQEKTVAGVTADDLARFHRRWVAGDNAVLAVFGDIDLDATEKLVGKLFGKDVLPRSEKPIRWPDPPAAPKGDQRFVQTTKVTQAAQVNFGFATVPLTDPDCYALTVLDTMISGYELPGGWLHETLRGQQLVYVVHAIDIAWRQAGLFYIYAQCQPAKVRQTIDAINQQLARAREGRFEPEQLVNAKSTILAADLMGLQTNDQLAAQCALDELLGRGYDHYLKLTERINAVTMEQVVAAARKYLVNGVTTVTTADPSAAGDQ